MYIIIALGIILSLCFIIQLTKLNPGKKFFLIDIFLVVLVGMIIYDESIYKFDDFAEQLQIAFQKQYPIEYKLDELIQKNNLQNHSFHLYYGMPSEGISTFFKFMINKSLKEKKQAIYIDIQSEVQTQEQALQLFKAPNLNELILFTKIKPTLIAIDNLDLSLTKKQCYICQILSSLHQFNSTTIIASAKNLKKLNLMLDDYNINVMEIKQYQHGKQNNFRFDWYEQSLKSNKRYEDFVLQKQREFVSELNENELQLMKTIRNQMCKVKCENQEVRLDDVTYQFGDLKNLVDKNIVIATFGQLKFYNSFIFDSLSNL
ncbi:unnamed protein product [Paramecium octaurelia]|uniref:Uncharacterized protein n=1 Tax=Paramecium octaurelia TaxID=43137 RepID=A0A8S1S3V0_PAROT|nr:unnamed protein product [Paramecium octaurelia]